MSSDTQFVLTLIAAFVLTIAVAFGGAYWMSSASCERIGIQVERTTEFYMWGGCFVELSDGRSVPIDENSIGLFLEER